MKKLLLGVAYLILASAPAFADVQLTMQNGRVTILAKDATVKQILNEWAKVGKTNIVNVEKVPGGPLTLELRNVTEGQALEVLLRSLSGYITAPRAEQAANLSQFDRIIIMPTIASARPATATAPPPVFQQQQQAMPGYPAAQAAPVMAPPPADDDVDDERPAPNVQIPNVPPPPGRSPAFNAVPMQAPTTAPQGTYPGMPVGGMPTPTNQPVPVQVPQPTTVSPFGGVAVPGMIVAPPPQPGQQPGQVQQPVPGQPGQPVRRPGGEN